MKLKKNLQQVCWGFEPAKEVNVKKDPKSFYLKKFFRGEMKSTHEYKHYKDQIKFNGSATIISQGETEDRKYNFYTPELILIMVTEKLEVIDRETKKEVIINGWQFFASFKEGYDAGVQYFESEYSILPDTLYGKHAELYIKDLHLNYFHIRHSGMKEGWHFVKNSVLS